MGVKSGGENQFFKKRNIAPQVEQKSIEEAQTPNPRLSNGSLLLNLKFLFWYQTKPFHLIKWCDFLVQV